MWRESPDDSPGVVPDQAGSGRRQPDPAPLRASRDTIWPNPLHDPPHPAIFRPVPGKQFPISWPTGTRHGRSANRYWFACQLMIWFEAGGNHVLP